MEYDENLIQEVPLDQLTDDVLNNMIEDFVTRDGTDYGEVEVGLPEKMVRLKRELKAGKVVITYDLQCQSFNFLPAIGKHR